MKPVKAIILIAIFFASTTARGQWTQLNLPDTLPLYSIYFVNDSTGFASSCDNNLSVWSSGGVYKTTDAGNSWDTLLSNQGYCRSSVFFVNENIGYSSGTNLIKTIDGGTTWFLPNLSSGLSSNFVYFINDSIGFINGYWSAPGPTIRKTTNGGISWSHSISFNPVSNITSLCFTSPQVGFAVGNDSAVVLKTTDGGANWNPVSTQYQLESVHFPSANDGYAVGFNGTIIHTNDSGNNWSQQVSGTTVNIHSIYCPSISTCYAVGDSGAILKTTDGGNTWIAQNSGTVQKLRSVYCTSSHCFAVGDSGVILKTVDGEVGFAENSASEQSTLIVFPNPANNELNIQINSIQTFHFTLYNSLGEKIIEQTLNNKSSTINLSAYSKGIYFYKMISDKSIIKTGKIIKQ